MIRTILCLLLMSVNNSIFCAADDTRFDDQNMVALLLGQAPDVPESLGQAPDDALETIVIGSLLDDSTDECPADRSNSLSRSSGEFDAVKADSDDECLVHQSSVPSRRSSKLVVKPSDAQQSLDAVKAELVMLREMFAEQRSSMRLSMSVDHAQAIERPASVLVSEPMLPSAFYRLPQGLSLAAIRIVAALNRAGNTLTLLFPVNIDEGIAATYLVLGTKVKKDGGSRRIERFLEPTRPIDMTALDPEIASRQFINAIKGHNERYVMQYDPTGVHTYQLNEVGRFVNKTKILEPSDALRDMVILIDHAKKPGISLVFESELPAIARS